MSDTSALKRLAQMGSNKVGGWYMAALEGVQETSGPGRTDPGWFHPSSMGNDCDAYWAFSYLGGKGLQTIKAQTRRVYDNGSGRDEYLKRDSVRSGVSLIEEFETPITCPTCGKENVVDTRHICILPLRIRGDLDDWAENPVTKRRFVVDFKTMNSNFYKNLEAVKPDHHTQVHPYMVAKDTYEGFVLYENKDTQEQKCMAANFDNSIWTGITDRIYRVFNDLEHDFVRRNPVSCGNCPFMASGTCTKNDIKKLKEDSHLYD